MITLLHKFVHVMHHLTSKELSCDVVVMATPVCCRYDVSGFPTLKFFAAGDKKPEDVSHESDEVMCAEL